ncbi:MULTISPECIES: transcription antiterminator [unclassified Streptococcus]|uniref:BglG family transcription antiterminator n=1 Tax=unclassified Streptococcus TaxID=2608887 RepID=UPI00107285D9|nr:MULTISPECIES: transcription antiterminator [unclassified Streptococcus]MBF0806128.1 transcription antiterminator [Streptococcus sp. 19428wA2_WM07]TFU28285.1 transcription antiterminator [Streptococcus sp. WM07]
MAIDHSSSALLQHLLHLTAPETISDIAKNLGQSRRKIYYHLDKINEALPDQTAPLVPRSRIGLLLNQEQKEACQQLLDRIDSYTYVLNSQERIQLLTLYIAISTERVTIEKMQQLIEVSRNTVLSDLSEMRRLLRLDQFRLTLTTTKSQGYVLRAQPFSKVQYVYHLLYSIFSDGAAPFLSIVKEKLNLENLLDDFGQIARQEWPQLEKIVGKRINRQELTSLTQILPYLLQTYRNMNLDLEQTEALQADFIQVHERVEYQAAQHLATCLAEEKGIILDCLEVDILTILLLSYRKDVDMHATSEDFIDLRATLEHYIWYFQNQSKYIVGKPEELLNQLTMHFKSLLFRKRYGIFSKNPLLEQIKSKYPDLFAYCRVTASLLEEAWSIHLTEDDIADLSIQMGGALKTPLDKGEEILHIYLVSDEGVAIQKMLLKQIQYHLPNEMIHAVFTTEQYRSVEDLLEVDLVITTSEGFEVEAPTLQVSPILESRDIYRIQQFIQDPGPFSSGMELRQQLEKLLTPYVSSPEEMKHLRYRIEKLYGQRMVLSQSEEG